MKRILCELKGVDCANCAAEIERAMQKANLISDARVSFLTERLSFCCEEADEEAAFAAVRTLVSKLEPNADLIRR